MKMTEEKKSLGVKILKAFLFFAVMVCVCIGVYKTKTDKQNMKQQSAIVVAMRSKESGSDLENKKSLKKWRVMPKIKQIKSEKKSPVVLKEKAEPKQETISENKKDYYVVVVVDDMGISPKHTKEIISIEAPLTSSFLTYGQNLKDFYEKASASGHEIMMHTPMEPKVKADLAPDTLKVSMSDDEIRTQFLNMLSKFEGANLKGINNHMGSRFTESAPKLDVVLQILKEKNMYFLDSRTTAQTVGEKVSQLEGVDYIKRDVFLDNENDYKYISKQLEQVEKEAFEKGYAVAICHPKSETYKALKDWVESLKDKDVKLVHLSDLIKKLKEKQKSS